MVPEPTTAEITKAVKAGVRHALREHALWGQSVAIERDGKIVYLSPEEIFAELRRQEQQDAENGQQLNGSADER